MSLGDREVAEREHVFRRALRTRVQSAMLTQTRGILQKQDDPMKRDARLAMIRKQTEMNKMYARKFTISGTSPLPHPTFKFSVLIENPVGTRQSPSAASASSGPGPAVLLQSYSNVDATC